MQSCECRAALRNRKTPSVLEEVENVFKNNCKWPWVLCEDPVTGHRTVQTS